MSLRHRLAFALRAPLDRLQLPGTRAIVEPLMIGASGMRDVRLSTGVRLRADLGARVERLEVFRAYERRELALMRRVLRPGDVVMDIGAHVGYYALHAAAAVGPGGSVHAFEPVPDNVERLRENISLNGFGNLTVTRAAVSEQAGRASFGAVEVPGESGWGSLLVTGDDHVREIEVDVVTVDGYAASAGLEGVDFMKIDVQGYELDVLRGATATLERSGPDVLTEVDLYCTAAAGHTPGELLAFMRERGYTSWGFPPRGRPVRFEAEELPGLNLFFTKRATLDRT